MDKIKIEIYLEPKTVECVAIMSAMETVDIQDFIDEALKFYVMYKRSSTLYRDVIKTMLVAPYESTES